MSYETRTGNASGVFYQGLPGNDPVYSQDTQFFFNATTKAVSVPRVSGVNQLVFNTGGGFGTPTNSGLVQIENSQVTFNSGVSVLGKLTGGFIDNSNIVGNAAILVTKLANSGVTIVPTAGSNQAANLGANFTFNQGSGIAVYGGTNGNSVTVSLSGLFPNAVSLGSSTQVPVITVNSNGIITATGQATLGAGAYGVQTTSATGPTLLSAGITLASGGANAIRVNLPTCAAATSGTLYTIKKIDYTSNLITIGVANGGDSLDGTPNGTRILSQRNESMTATCDGQTNGNWWIV